MGPFTRCRYEPAAHHFVLRRARDDKSGYAPGLLINTLVAQPNSSDMNTASNP